MHNCVVRERKRASCGASKGTTLNVQNFRWVLSDNDMHLCILIVQVCVFRSTLVYRREKICPFTNMLLCVSEVHLCIFEQYKGLSGLIPDIYIYIKLNFHSETPSFQTHTSVHLQKLDVALHFQSQNVAFQKHSKCYLWISGRETRNPTHRLPTGSQEGSGVIIWCQ